MLESSNPPPSNTFRFSFWSLFRTGTGIILLLTLADFFLFRSSNGIGLLVRSMLTQVVLSGVLWWLMVQMFPLRVTPEGLHGQTSLGAPCFLSWAEMEKVRPAPISRALGIPFVYIHSFQKGRASLCIPLFLTRFPAFRQAVRDVASPLNPLRQSLENDGMAAERIADQNGLTS